jgi:dipeptidyl aminopeptidase/acylaminoacyl peptidase
VRVTRRLDYKADGSGYLGDRRRQVFVVEVEGGARRQLTEATVDHSLPLWSPDGRYLAVQVANRESQGSRLGLIEVASGRTRLVGAEKGVVGVWAWSPGGERILFAGDETITGQLDFFVYELASDQVRRLTDDLACLPDAGRMGVAPAAPLVWLDERLVLFHAFRAGASGLHVIDSQTGRVEPVKDWSALKAGLSADAAGIRVVQTHTRRSRAGATRSRRSCSSRPTSTPGGATRSSWTCTADRSRSTATGSTRSSSCWPARASWSSSAIRAARRPTGATSRCRSGATGAARTTAT